MSATAFQRMRREQAARNLDVNTEIEEEQPKTLGELTIKELKALLDQKGIEHDARANKATLLGLAEQAQKLNEPEDESNSKADLENDDGDDEGAE